MAAEEKTQTAGKATRKKATRRKKSTKKAAKAQEPEEAVAEAPAAGKTEEPKEKKSARRAKSVKKKRTKRSTTAKAPAPEQEETTSRTAATAKTTKKKKTTKRRKKTAGKEADADPATGDNSKAQPVNPDKDPEGEAVAVAEPLLDEIFDIREEYTDPAAAADLDTVPTPQDETKPARGRSGEDEETGRKGRRRSRRRRKRKDRRPEGDSESEKETQQKNEPADRTAIETRSGLTITEIDEDDFELAEGDGQREMVINVSAGDECRVAVLHEGKLEELFIERESTQSLVGNIYKGRVTNVEPSIQAVFVDFGLPKNGFLHISDVQPQYFPGRKGKGQTETVGRKMPRYSRPPIQDCFRRGDQLVVQVTKEGVGTKGPTLSTYLSIPGRFLVMMPGMNKLGVSRKIDDDDARRKLREQLDELELPGGMGFIVRTAGMGRTKRDLQRDLNYLMRLWKTVAERIRQRQTPAELYRESDLVIRTIRDVYTSAFKRVIVDDPSTAEKVGEFLQIAMPRGKANVELYTAREPLFHRLGIEEEIERINTREVPLRSGGSIVIESTEAMVAIDVNSGRFRSPDDAEETAYRINLEAAEEIARQLRLRDLGGLIVCDFIDMRFDRHKRAVERKLRDALKKHKERARTLRMSAFGLIEITRQRRGPSMKRNTYSDCPHCQGTGLVKMPSSVILDVMRIVQLGAHREEIARVRLTVANNVAFQILNQKRAVLAEVERETNTAIVIRGDASFRSDQIQFDCEDKQGMVTNALQPMALTNGKRK